MCKASSPIARALKMHLGTHKVRTYSGQRDTSLGQPLVCGGHMWESSKGRMPASCTTIMGKRIVGCHRPFDRAKCMHTPPSHLTEISCERGKSCRGAGSQQNRRNENGAPTGQAVRPPHPLVTPPPGSRSDGVAAMRVIQRTTACGMTDRALWRGVRGS